MNNLNDRKGTLEDLEKRVEKLITESKDPEFTVYLQKMSERIRHQKYQTDLLKAEVDRSYEMYLNRMKLAEPKQYFNLMDDVPQQQMTPVIAVPKKKRNAEFTVGAAVLSIVGGGFILAALVSLGMTFMEGIFKGICLYAISLVFLLVSELIVYRKWPMLGATLSAIGIGGLYLSTVVNYLGLHIFNLWVTLGITLVITLLVILLSRRRDSILYRMIGLIAGYLCFFTIREGITDTEFIVVVGMILLLNVLCILLPVRKHRTGIHITHMSLNTIFAVCFMIRALVGCELTELPVWIFVISSMIVLQLLVVQFYYHKKKNHATRQTGILSVYYISVATYAVLSSMLIVSLIDIEMNNWYCYGSAIAVGLIGILAILTLCIGRCQGQWHIYTFLNLLIFCIIGCSNGVWDTVICLLAMLVVVKIVSRKNILTLRMNDFVITSFICVSVILLDAPQSYVLLAGVVFSILTMHYWQTCYEIILTITLVAYTANCLPTVLQLPAIVGILLVGILLFNNVKRWQGKYIRLFNILALIGQTICLLKLWNPIYQNAYITYLCMLVFGLATIVLTLQEKYQMNFKGRYMVLAVFLTYMAFIFRTNVPVVNSILLMVIALVCVGIGFGLNIKSVRIYGLVLSLVVCGKLVLYDFFGAATLQKTILFFAVGVIALVIATIYIILEKRQNN